MFALFVKAHNFVSNGAGPAGFLLMLIVEDPDTCRSITIIFDAFGKNGDQGRFTGINVTNDTEFEELGVLVFDRFELFWLHGKRNLAFLYKIQIIFNFLKVVI